jgi:hypothetical protein
VAGELHRHSFWDARANHVAHGRPAQIVRNPARAAGCTAGVCPRLIERLDRLRLLVTAALTSLAKQIAAGVLTPAKNEAFDVFLGRVAAQGVDVQALARQHL